MYAIPYWDEDGVYHNDDPNVTTTTYECSNNHRWTVRTRMGQVIPDASP